MTNELQTYVCHTVFWRNEVNKLIFDAGPLITACKFDVRGRLVVDYIRDHYEIIVATSVCEEVIVAGARYPDAQAARERIDNGRIDVLAPPTELDLGRLLEPYNLGIGEYESILLTQHSEAQNAVVIIDDHLAYLVSDRIGCRQRFLLDVILDMGTHDKLNSYLAIEIVQAIRTRYPPAFVEHTLIALQR